MEILEFTYNLSQFCKVSSRTDIDHANIHFRIKNPCKRLEFKELVHQTAIGVVRCSLQANMVFTSAPYPLQKIGILRLCEVLICCHDAIAVVGQMRWLQEGVITVLQALDIARKHEHETTEGKPYLVTLEEHIRTRRIYIYMILLKEAGKCCYSRMLHGIEEKRNLIIVRKFSGGFQVVDKLQYLLVPLIRIVHACEFHDCGTVESGFLVRFNPFIVTEVIPAKLELRTVCGSHPLIVEVNDVTVGAVVNDQRNHSAFAFCKLLRKLQDITDGSTSKSIQALVIVTDHADVLTVSGEKEHKLLLNEVRVLVLVHHDVRNLGAKLLQNLDIVLQQMIGFNLDRREVHQIALSEDIAVLLQYPSKSRNRQVSIGHQFLWRH